MVLKAFAQNSGVLPRSKRSGTRISANCPTRFHSPPIAEDTCLLRLGIDQHDGALTVSRTVAVMGPIRRRPAKRLLRSKRKGRIFRNSGPDGFQTELPASLRVSRILAYPYPIPPARSGRQTGKVPAWMRSTTDSFSPSMRKSRRRAVMPQTIYGTSYRLGTPFSVTVRVASWIRVGRSPYNELVAGLSDRHRAEQRMFRLPKSH